MAPHNADTRTVTFASALSWSAAALRVWNLSRESAIGWADASEHRSTLVDCVRTHLWKPMLHRGGGG